MPESSRAQPGWHRSPAAPQPQPPAQHQGHRSCSPVCWAPTSPSASGLSCALLAQNAAALRHLCCSAWAQGQHCHPFSSHRRHWIQHLQLSVLGHRTQQGLPKFGNACRGGYHCTAGSQSTPDTAARTTQLPAMPPRAALCLERGLGVLGAPERYQSRLAASRHCLSTCAHQAAAQRVLGLSTGSRAAP